MKTQLLCVACALGVAIAGCAPAQGNNPTSNPVDLERQAIQQLEAPEQAGVAGLLEQDVDAIPLDQKTGDILKKAKPPIDLLRQAGQQPITDWGPAVDDVQPVLGSLSRARRAVLLLRLQARYEFAHGEPNQAIDDLIAAMTIGRHIGQRKIIVAHLTEIGCEAVAIEELAAMLPKLPKNIVQTMPARLAKVPSTISLKETLLAEKVFADKQLQQQLAPPPGASEAALKRNGEIRAECDAQLTAFYEDIAKFEHASPPDFQKAVTEAAAKAKSPMMIVMLQVMAPSLSKYRHIIAVSEVREAMLLTAISIVGSGESEVAKSRDPFGDGPFKFEKKLDGFVLASALKNREAPVSLTVGP